MGSWVYVCSRQTVTLLYIHPLCALATCYPGLTGWRIQGWCSSARSGGQWLFVHRFASYIATAGRNQKLGLEEVDVCYESINGGWSPVLSKKSQLGWMTPSYTLSYSGRNNLTHQSSPSWSVGDQLPRLAKWARYNTGVLLLTRGSVRERPYLAQPCSVGTRCCSLLNISKRSRRLTRVSGTAGMLGQNPGHVHSGETDEANCSWLHPVWPRPKRPDQDNTFCMVSRASTELIFCIHRDSDVRNNVCKLRRLVCECCRDICAWKSRAMKPTVLEDEANGWGALA